MGSLRESRGWTRAAAAVLAGALAFGIAGCGSSDEDSGSGGETITVKHAKGETAVPTEPQKVVVLGSQWLDTALALGLQPAAYLDPAAVQANAAPAWQTTKPTGQQLNATGNVPEQVAALEPDLILTDSFIANQANNYDELSKIAPTVSGLSEEIITPWQDLVTTLGDILNKDDEAAALIQGVNDKIAGLTAANPGLQGKTFASTFLYSASQLMVLTDPKDGSAKLMEQLGLTIPQNLRDQPAAGGRLALSPERVGELTADLLLAGYTPGMDEKFRQLPGFGELLAVRKDAVVFMTTQEITGVNQPTVLSIPFVLDKISPALANAAK
ncbi:ABC transporter substrate-binding protein [Nocardia puris]|uniref:ABC transporter substrate-binding protein n=1 Tax=Nocardia puris TaxID=208602 RepID=UPI0018945A73|nr:ABC transporter substrate-binding protein [Nocardia puris]MBF6211588.1 ABC transporter substrate-binding protein [Nocardia puris]MBF6366840.1 ABC transporter substrate-binding protein [Nocardia puris]MBF6460772.1 ABC transporter substrate-binding protein [Nocardia puris]